MRLYLGGRSYEPQMGSKWVTKGYIDLNLGLKRLKTSVYTPTGIQMGYKGLYRPGFVSKKVKNKHMNPNWDPNGL